MNQTHKCKYNCNLLIQSGRFGEVVQNNLLSKLRKMEYIFLQHLDWNNLLDTILLPFKLFIL